MEVKCIMLEVIMLEHHARTELRLRRFRFEPQHKCSLCGAADRVHASSLLQGRAQDAVGRLPSWDAAWDVSKSSPHSNLYMFGWHRFGLGCHISSIGPQHSSARQSIC
jgi:hypothetical protein